MVDGTVVSDSPVDLSDTSSALGHLGVGMPSTIAPGTAIAVLYDDNVLLKSP